MERRTRERLAELVVGAGANVRPGQVVLVQSEPGKEELAREVARAAYRRGARYVEVASFDLHVKRARIEHGRAEDLDWVPPWTGQQMLTLGELRGARITLTGAVAPSLFDGLDPALVGRDQLPRTPEMATVANARSVNWSVVSCPTPAWAALVHPGERPDVALSRLGDQLAHVLRLDVDDPPAAWRARLDDLERTAAALDAHRFDALRFRGPGTDLRVGLLPSSRWTTARMETVDGVRHVANLPTEEVFTAPDPERVDGEVRATRPLVLGGTVVEGLRVRFAGGRAVAVHADRGGEVLETLIAHDAGAARLGELALVDREGRVGALGTCFYDTLLDENAASHLAFGAAYAATVGDEADRERINRSAIHVDFMVGAPEVDVDGLAADGTAVPLLRGGDWQIDRS